MFEKLSFAHLLGAVLALSFIIGFAEFVLSGATTNKGTTGAIGSENASIMSAEKSDPQCTNRRPAENTILIHGVRSWCLRRGSRAQIRWWGPAVGTG
jgi:hypothetical protein